MSEQLDKLDEILDSNASMLRVWPVLRPIVSEDIGQRRLDRLVAYFQGKDAKPKTAAPRSWFSGYPYRSYLDWFTRALTDEKMQYLQFRSCEGSVIMPNECVIESVGTIMDTTTILRLKKNRVEAYQSLRSFGMPAGYGFINMKLGASYYHRIHSPVKGKVTKIIGVGREAKLFARSTLWLIEIMTEIYPVYLMIVGESVVQDFDFQIEEGQRVDVMSELGNYTWGSQTLLFLPTEEVVRMDTMEKGYYFVGHPLLREMRGRYEAVD